MSDKPSHDDRGSPESPGELRRRLEAAMAELECMRDENRRLARRVDERERQGAPGSQSADAAVHPSHGAAQARPKAEPSDREQQHEAAERKRAEATLRASEDGLRMLADTVPQIIWGHDAHGRANYFNRRWYEFSGLAFEQSAGLGWEAIVHPDDAAVSRRKWHEALARGEPFDCEYRLRRADGCYRWFIGRAEPLRNAEGQIAGWFGTATEIQELKEAQSVVREREEQFRRALEDAPIPVIMHAEDGQVLQISRTWTELTGYTREEIPTFDAWLTRAYGEGADAVRQWMRDVFRLDRADSHREFEIVSRTGERRHWLFRASSLGALGDGRRYAVGMAVDLTERNRAQTALVASQERMRLIVEGAIEHAIIVMDPDRRVTSWNSGAEHILGYRRDEIVHQSADVIFTPEDLAAGMPEREAGAALKTGRAADERWHMRKDGSRFWGSGVMLPIYEQPGSPPTGLLKILRDETKRREAEQQLEASRQQLLVALHAKDDFLATLSHELRTPLNPVLLLSSEAAENPSLPDPVRSDFAAIRKNVQLEARLIDDLLDLTRLARGKLPLERRETDAHVVLRDAIAILGAEAERKGIPLRIELAARQHHLYADPVRVQQVFWNVLSNALKFTPPGGRIAVHSRNPPPGDRLLIEVTDTGIGMTGTELERVFDAFTQGEHAEEGRTSRFGGLGLGLSISKKLVEAHGGSIRAVSVGRGHGTTVEIDFPVVPPVQGRPIVAGPVGSLTLDPRTIERLRRERILLVEDHEPTRQALAGLLRRRGLEVETAGSAAEARQIAQRAEITLLVSDIGLPDGDGYRLMEELRTLRGVRGIALTGYGTDQDLARSRHAGFAAHLTKPISAQALDRTLAGMVE